MKTILVTGSNGGIGSAIAARMKQIGFFVIGIDNSPDKNNLDEFIISDLNDLVLNENKVEQLTSTIDELSNSHNFYALVNNAAIQILGDIKSIKINDFQKTLNINVIAPFILSKILYKQLQNNKGSIVNIGSVHSKLSKPGFLLYSTSKSALKGMSNAMSLEMGDKVRVNSIHPAAVNTQMLKDGLTDEGFLNLQNFHPTRSISSPEEVAICVEFLINNRLQFLNGSNIELDGGISSRLHDPQ